MEQGLIECLDIRLLEKMENVSQIDTKLCPPEVAENPDRPIECDMRVRDYADAHSFHSCHGL